MSKFLTYGSKGAAVRALQRELNANPFRKFDKPLVVDGELGPRTASRIHNVKYWAGYAPADLDPDLADQIAGRFFRALITKDRPLPDMYRARRRRRIEKRKAAAAATPLREKILAAAKRDVGILEGANNAIKFNDWWADGTIGDGDTDGGAYCVRAGSYWAAKGGCPHVIRGYRWQNTDHLLTDAKRGANGVHLTSDPKPGNGFVIDWSGRSDPDHFGLFVSEIPGDLFRSLEANATLASGRQGVGYHERPARQCWFLAFET